MNLTFPVSIRLKMMMVMLNVMMGQSGACDEVKVMASMTHGFR